MSAPHPFPQLVPARVAAALRRLEERVWLDQCPLGVEATAPTISHHSLEEAKALPRTLAKRGEMWGRLFDQRWCRVQLPELPAPSHLLWDDDGEATLWLEGMPHYGLDVAHRRAPLPAGGPRDIWLECYCCQSAFWHPDAHGLSPHGSAFSGATLLRRDDDVWAAYHDLKCLYDLAIADKPASAKFSMLGFQPSLWRAPAFLRRLLRGLNEAIDALDISGVAAMRQSLTQLYEELRDREPLLHATLTGHAHIDLVWLWPERMGEAKAVHTFATVNRLMEAYPELRFAYSQPASYEAVTRRAPNLAEAVGKRVRDGLWQPTGALYVESDTLLTCGEALARSLTVGQEAFVALRGEPSRLVWLPDVFGYSACLPQIMKLSGVDCFFTTKLTWSALNRFPFSSFVWRGSDGSEVLTHVTQETGYNGVMQIDELRAAAEGHAQSDIHAEFLQPTGFGDGGGGPTEEMCERARRFTALRGMPAARWDHPEAFFTRLAPLRGKLPVYQGECYLEFHRGTYTTQAAIKSVYRALERTLQLREAVIVATGTGGAAPDLTAAWRRLIFAQFHDCLPGSSIPDVYAEVLPELVSLVSQQVNCVRETLGGRQPSIDQSCLFNPLPISRTVEHQGHCYEIPPLSGVPLAELEPLKLPVPWIEDQTLQNGRVVAVIDEDGLLTKLFVDGRTVEFSAPAARLVTYTDNPSAFDAWDIDRHTLGLATPVTTPATLHREENAIVVSRAVGRSSWMTLRYWLVAGESVLRMSLRIDWRDPETLLKLHFPTVYQGAAIRCGAPFGSVLRDRNPGSAQAEAMWEMPMSRYVSVGDAGEREGFFAVTEAKYGVSCRDGDLGISLVRSPRLVGYEAHRPSYPAGLSRHEVDAHYSDIGEHSIELAIGCLRPDMPLCEQPAALADLLYTPVIGYHGQAVSSSLRKFSSESLWPCWVKPESNGKWTLRLHEVLGRRGRAQIDFADGWTAVPVDLRGVEIGAPLSESWIDYRPSQIISLRIEPPVRLDARSGC